VVATGETAAPMTRRFYEVFQRADVDGFDGVVADDVEMYTPAGWGMRGLDTLKNWVGSFAHLAHRIDLVDDHLALDGAGDGRGFITFALYWKHEKDFFGLAPTGREGTSLETAIFTIRNHRIVRIDVADNTLDLVLYMWDRNWPHPHNIQPKALITGVERASA
jgi:ketosteroid isomerase-like protein